jgi:hypothetical protein
MLYFVRELVEAKTTNTAPGKISFVNSVRKKYRAESKRLVQQKTTQSFRFYNFIILKDLDLDFSKADHPIVNTSKRAR